MRVKSYVLFCLIYKLFLSDVPSAPYDVDVNEIFHNSCVVSFKPSKDDGGAPILKYVIERLDLSLKAQWDNVGEVMQGEKCVYKVEDLIAKKEYKFRIRAVNKLGSSEPAMFGKPVLAKDPWGTFQRTQINGNLYVEINISFYDKIFVFAKN